MWIEIGRGAGRNSAPYVTPFAGVWIETDVRSEFTCYSSVTPFAGVWIEMQAFPTNSDITLSLPSRECGLKLRPLRLHCYIRIVTPFAGVWIEIQDGNSIRPTLMSLPSRECGLKFLLPSQPPWRDWSLPSRECGLKSTYQAWHGDDTSHSLRGSVD